MTNAKTVSFWRYLGRYRRIGLLQKVPEFFPLLCAAGVIKLLAFPLPHGLCLPLELLVHLLLFLVVPRLAAGLQVDLIDSPVVQLLAERQGAHLLHHVQFARAVEVQDRSKCPRVPIEEVLILFQVVVIAYIHEGFVGVAVSELTQPCPR